MAILLFYYLPVCILWKKKADNLSLSLQLVGTQSLTFNTVRIHWVPRSGRNLHRTKLQHIKFFCGQKTNVFQH